MMVMTFSTLFYNNDYLLNYYLENKFIVPLNTTRINSIKLQ